MMLMGILREMKKILGLVSGRGLTLFLLLIFTPLLGLSSCVGGYQSQDPFILDLNELNSIKNRIKENSPREVRALDLLKKSADSVLKIPPHSVVEKSIIPPSGNKHDYVSMAQYWWPNPETPDGLPYIRKDGSTNPESYRKVRDRSYLYALSRNIQILGIVYFYTNNEVYAKKACDLLETWFIDEETKMNPNLNYGQYIPGRVDGRREGIIDTRGFVDMLDAVQLLQSSEHWSSRHYGELQKWFKDYLEWLQFSPLGREAADRLKNNIGTAYDMQLISYSLFTGDKATAKKVILERIPLRMETQFDISGRQPNELARKDSWNYCLVNLRYWMKIARLAENLDIDVWHFRTSSGKSLEAVYNWMLPFGQDLQKWSYGKSKKINIAESFRPIVKRASSKFSNKNITSKNSVNVKSSVLTKGNTELDLSAIEILKGSN